jgi:hypothetical protein
MEPGKSGLATLVFNCGPQQTYDAGIIQYKSAAAFAAGEHGRAFHLFRPMGLCHGAGRSPAKHLANWTSTQCGE